MLVDRVVIRVRSGRGGDGCVAFRREKFVPRGGPSGGDGGRGGDVVLEVDPRMHTLLDLRYRNSYQAENGRPGQGSEKSGKSGQDAVVPVPPGTVVRDVEEDAVLGDLVEPGQRLLVAKGGKGGHGNARFKSSIHQAPQKFTPGGAAEELTLELELKLIADVGLVGLPNAGKSTLLASLSDARPKIADYPFTTLEPNLGLVRTSQYRSLVMADVPGLIEGASDGRGLGKEFLRHVERCRVLLHLVDATEPDIAGAYRTVRREIKAYGGGLARKKEIVALSKCDAVGPEEIAEKVALLQKAARKKPLVLSAVAGLGVKEALFALAREIGRKTSAEDELEAEDGKPRGASERAPWRS